MWTWLGIAILARVLMASSSADLEYQSRDSLSDVNQISENIGEAGESSQGELLAGTKVKPKLSKIDKLQWKNDQIYRDLNPNEKSISNLIRELSGSSESKIVQKELDDQRDKRSSTKDDDKTSPSSWMTWVTLENKALPFRNGQDPWQEIKKSRAFSPWGGKRVTSVYGQGVKVRRPIRVPFNSWGGKRSFPDNQKRTKFSSWGGKRGWYLNSEENSLENGIEKRTKFNAWGGKRSKNDDREDEEIKRTRFNAWGGKRNEQNYKRTPEEIVAKKSVFNAWGGKRFYNIDETNEGDEFKNIVEKENNDDNNNNNNNNNNIEENDRNDNVESEIPSENEIMIELPKEKKMDEGVDKLHKSLFNPWGGKKKRDEYDEELIAQGLNLIRPESNGIQSHHHERFWPWGG